MYGTTRRLSLCCVLLCFVIVFMALALILYLPILDIPFYLSIAISVFIACVTAVIVMMTIAVRSLRQELEWEFEQDSKTIKNLKHQVHELEEKLTEKH